MEPLRISADAAVADDRTVECVIQIGDSVGSAATRNGDVGNIIQIGSTSVDHGIEQHHLEGYGAINQLFGGGCDVDRGLEQFWGAESTGGSNSSPTERHRKSFLPIAINLFSSSL